MFKRLRWLTLGAIGGFGGSYWLQRRVRQAVDRFTPESMQADVKAAFREGRTAMQDRETELRARYRPPGRPQVHR